MKTVKIHAHCTVCDFSVEYDLGVNKYGFFSISEAFCPNDLMILDQEIKKLPEDSDDE